MQDERTTTPMSSPESRPAWAQGLLVTCELLGRCARLDVKFPNPSAQTTTIISSSTGQRDHDDLSITSVHQNMSPFAIINTRSVSPLSINSQNSLQDTSLLLHNAQLKPLLILLLRLAAEALGRGGLEDSAFPHLSCSQRSGTQADICLFCFFSSASSSPPFQSLCVLSARKSVMYPRLSRVPGLWVDAQLNFWVGCR